MNQSEGRTDFYAVKYASFGSDEAVALRREVFGDDIGHEGWTTTAEYAEVADLLAVGAASQILDVCCGSGGPALTLIQRAGCRVTGIDRENAAIVYAQAQASSRGHADRATFAVVDCNGALPFADESFDAVLCIDAILHLRDRFGTLREWARLLRAKGRLVFTDVAVITGEIAKSELDVRTASGFFLFVPPGLNEAAIEAAPSPCWKLTIAPLPWQTSASACTLPGFATLPYFSARKALTASRNGRRFMPWPQNWRKPAACRVFSMSRRNPARK